MADTLQRGQTIPDFTLDDIHGAPVASRGYYMRRNLVIALLPEAVEEAGIRWIEHLMDAMESVPSGDAIALVVASPAWSETASSLAMNDGSVRFLVDSGGNARARFNHPEGHLQLLITDRHGVVFHRAIGDPELPALDPVEVPGWIEFIACRCS